MAEDERKGDRIAKLLARAGVASRREVERMIADKRIAIDGKTVETPATLLESLRGVTVDGKPVAKPDPRGRPTIYDALRNSLPKDAPRVMPIGRLDFNTEGLLLLTNDGEFKRMLELPANAVERTYRARAHGGVTQAQLEELSEGITIDGVHYGPINANLERRTGANQWIEVTITEGKNREVRRVLEHLGLEVNRLVRVAFGPVALGDLPRGQAMEIRKHEIGKFRASVKKGRD